MLKKLTLAAFFALGTAAMAGAPAAPVAAENIRSAGGYEHGGYSFDVHVSRHHGHRAHASRYYGPNWRFLRAVRHGRIVCFKKRLRHHGHRFDRHRYRPYRAHGRRLGYRAVRRLVRRGHRHAIRCFRSV